MENKIRIESKFLDSIGKWCVAVYLGSEYDGWFDNCFDKNRDRAEKRVLELAKKHIDFVRELKKSAEVRDSVLVY